MVAATSDAKFVTRKCGTYLISKPYFQICTLNVYLSVRSILCTFPSLNIFISTAPWAMFAVRKNKVSSAREVREERSRKQHETGERLAAAQERLAAQNHETRQVELKTD